MPRTTRKLAEKRLAEIDRELERGEAVEIEVAQEKEELKRIAGREWRLNLWLLLGLLFVLAVGTALLRAVLVEGGVAWLFTIPALPDQVGDLTVILAPFLAVAVSIERLLETTFSWYEQSIQTVSDVLAKVKEPINWVEKELQQAHQAAVKAAEATGVEEDPASLHALQLAEERLAQAERRLLSWTKAPEYVAWKQAIAIWVGLLVGLEVAVLGDFGLLRAIGVPAPRLLDMLATGLVVGAGPGPMHAVIGMLQGGKKVLENLADLAEGRAAKESFQDLRMVTDQE
jgi:hypothetical protein